MEMHILLHLDALCMEMHISLFFFKDCIFELHLNAPFTRWSEWILEGKYRGITGRVNRSYRTKEEYLKEHSSLTS
jgi:hypothetical protein